MPPTATQPGSNGDVGAKAVERYRTDKVKQVQTMLTTESVSGGSGGAGGATGPQ